MRGSRDSIQWVFDMADTIYYHYTVYHSAGDVCKMPQA